MTDETILFKAGKFNHAPAKGTCAECPLRRDSKPGALGGWTARMYMRGMLSSADFACHMSKGFDVQDPTLMRSCTGVANFRANIEAPMVNGNAKTAVQIAGKNRVDVFDSLGEFYEHHKSAKRE